MTRYLVRGGWRERMKRDRQNPCGGTGQVVITLKESVTPRELVSSAAQVLSSEGAGAAGEATAPTRNL
jgi:hypothetical protein